MLPNFLIIGAQKAGTTSLLRYLSAHPDVFVLQDKEISCFYNSAAYNSKFHSYSYENYFQGWTGQKCLGNAPVNTLYFAEQTAKNIYTLARSIKLIAILRNPIDRAYSAYWYFVRNGIENRTFEEALAGESYILKEGSFSELCNFTYVSHGFYYSQLIHFYKYFDDKQLLLLLFDDFKNYPELTLTRVCEFLEIDNSIEKAFIRQKYNVSAKARLPLINRIIYDDNSIKKLYQRYFPTKLRHAIKLKLIPKLININLVPHSYPPMSPSNLKYLRQTFLEPNLQLQELLDFDISSWTEISD